MCHSLRGRQAEGLSWVRFGWTLKTNHQRPNIECTGIGWPTDKRASHALPRLAMGPLGRRLLSKSATQSLWDFLPIDRAARIVAPISDHIEHRYFDGGVFHVLHMLSDFDIDVEAGCAPPKPPFSVPSPPLTRQWFASIQHHRSGADYLQVAEWNRLFLDWIKASLKVSRHGILANLSSPSGQFHAPIENVDTAGASWSFPQALAWIATRDPIEVARIQYSQHFGPPMVDAQPHLRAMMQSDSDRRKLIGWLVLQTSLKHCKCGSAVTLDREAWETCQCVGRAYDELRAFADGTANPMPEYQPKPAYASFTLTWPDGAHELRFTRAAVTGRWSQLAGKSSTVAGEGDCAAWLERAILADTTGERKKSSFRSEALKMFEGRVTATGFNQRIWPPIAQRHGRNRAGAPRQS